MALFYEHVKGLDSENNITKIKWGSSNPEIQVGNNSFGSIITSNAESQTIEQPFTFNATVTFGATDANTTIERNIINSNTITATNVLVSPKWKLSNTLYAQYQNVGNKYGKDALVITSTTHTNNAELYVNGNIFATYRLDALFVNTTSDMRAKHDLQRSTFNATEIITNTPVYNFTYNDSNIPSIGILAQDVASLNLGDFSLVDNIEATGQGDDMMHLKETKLIYILWKALQEQDQRIKELEQQLKNK